MTWKTIPTPIPDLKKARLNLHFAMQPAAAAQVALAEHKPDFSHTSMLYDPISGNLTGRDCKTSDGIVRPFLHLETMTLGLHTVEGDILESTVLFGQTVAEALSWMSEALNSRGASVTLSFPEYPDFPESNLRTSATFAADEISGIELLAKLYSNSYQAIAEGVGSEQGASEIRTWPHHFDMACLVELPKIKSDASVGIGFSPGDEGVPEPYWYVTPWPYPPAENLPELPGPAKWNTDGWVGAVLKSSELFKESDPSKVLSEYISGGFGSAKELLIKANES